MMKKDVIITARITQEIKETIQSLADRDERTLAWMIRKLIFEALEARSLRDPVHDEAGEHASRGISRDRIGEEIAAYGREDERRPRRIMGEATLFLTIPGLRSIFGSGLSGAGSRTRPHPIPPLDQTPTFRKENIAREHRVSGLEC